MQYAIGAIATFILLVLVFGSYLYYKRKNKSANFSKNSPFGYSAETVSEPTEEEVSARAVEEEPLATRIIRESVEASRYAAQQREQLKQEEIDASLTDEARRKAAKMLSIDLKEQVIELTEQNNQGSSILFFVPDEDWLSERWGKKKEVQNLKGASLIFFRELQAMKTEPEIFMGSIMLSKTQMLFARVAK